MSQCTPSTIVIIIKKEIRINKTLKSTQKRKKKKFTDLYEGQDLGPFSW
jgi:hypothetical protein